jgi:L-ribulose-5-phosphate 4-epimerase
MLLPRLRTEVCEANLELVRRGLVTESFGNASGIARDRGLVVIKPSGVDYARLKPASLVITDLKGKVIEGRLRPSSDLPTHIEIYKAFPCAGGVAHTHSHFATAWAQAGLEIPCFGTTHADYFPGPIPVTRPLGRGEVRGAYETNTGLAIVRRFKSSDPAKFNAVLVHGHGPFCWGTSSLEASRTAVIVESLAQLAHDTVRLNPRARELDSTLRDRHYYRKHGAGAYYGQR